MRTPASSAETVSSSRDTVSGRAAHGFRWAGHWPAPQVEQHEQTQRRKDDGNELGRRQPHEKAALVRAIELDDESRHCVEKHVPPEGAARERSPLALGR